MASRLLTNEEAGFDEEQLKKIATAKQHKETGDQAFKAGKMREALMAYHNANMYCKGINKMNVTGAMGIPGTDAPSSNDQQKTHTEVDEMMEKIYGNMSAAHIKLGNWKRALETAEQALAKNPDNLKALFRKGKALSELGWFERGEPILLDVRKRNPGDAPTIDAELTRLRAIEKERERKANQKMKGWYNRDKGNSASKSASKTEEDEKTQAGPAPVASASIEEVL